MVLFFPNQQTLDCISDSGQVLGQIIFQAGRDEYSFAVAQSVQLTEAEQSGIAAKIAQLIIGQSSIPMQDDD
ncbi:hypothetical protein [Marinomonas ostreistagni]|uniref:Uncharacterized protein n=1 Tax=Marinomonas ostreistagni TaxID=359209 RepID=A0ABS0ZDA0_9GAMM|nr:hypothetical protein [Marinomonas ostreistagni]MBJ7551657.1 hypothetical protein [Marinomonas ostreistagni]